MVLSVLWRNRGRWKKGREPKMKKNGESWDDAAHKLQVVLDKLEKDTDKGAETLQKDSLRMMDHMRDVREAARQVKRRKRT